MEEKSSFRKRDAKALGLGQSHGGLLKDFLSQEAIKAHIENDLAMELLNPVRFIRPGRGGKPAIAYEATILPRLCDAVLEARKQNKNLSKRQSEVAEQCEIITRVLAKVGIIALVDEVTGYQDVRDRQALQKILDKYLNDEWAKWSRTFPDDYYKELFRLNDVPYPTANGIRPSYVGHWTNDIVYSRLAPGVKSALKVKNPRLQSGNRARRHHQYFTRDFGHPELKQHLSNIIFLMKVCKTYDEFKEKLDVASPKFGDTIPLALEMKSI
ncbi:MAG: P63C domain-containing protein [Verrucomicrobiia bacterium]